jgi:hypothetical protein
LQDDRVWMRVAVCAQNDSSLFNLLGKWPIGGPRDLKARSRIQVRTANALMPKRRDRIKTLLGRAGLRAEDGKTPPHRRHAGGALFSIGRPATRYCKKIVTFILQISFWQQRFIQSSLFSLTSKTLWFWFNCVCQKWLIPEYSDVLKL